MSHEGYPVEQDGQVVGLLTMQALNRALEHDLHSTEVRDIMLRGDHFLKPDDSLERVEQLIVASQWGQLPVVDAQKRLLGIVTRTDLIRQWAGQHTESQPARPSITQEAIEQTLGKAIAKLIQQVGSEAVLQQTRVYMVGGAVRDILLERNSDDIDFVIEGDAIAFAQLVHDKFGGSPADPSAVRHGQVVYRR